MTFPETFPTVPEFSYSLESLRALPTLAEGQADNLKFDEDGYRVWLSRCTVEDGEPFDNAVTIERFDGQRWVEVAKHPAPTEREGSYGLLAQLYLVGYNPTKHSDGWAR